MCCYVTRTARTAAQPASVFFTCGGATSCFQPPYTHIQLIMEMLRVSKLLIRLLNVTQKLVGLQEMETTTTHHHRHCVSQLSLWPVQVTHSATTRREHSGDSPTLTAVRYYLFIYLLSHKASCCAAEAFTSTYQAKNSNALHANSRLVCVATVDLCEGVKISSFCQRRSQGQFQRMYLWPVHWNLYPAKQVGS